MFTKKVVSTASMLVALGLSSSVMAETFSFISKEHQAKSMVVFQAGNTISADLSRLDSLSNQQISKALKIAKFEGKNKQVIEILAPAGLATDRLLIVGLGDAVKLDAGQVNLIGAQIQAKLTVSDADNVQVFTQGISDNNSNASFAAQLAHGINLRAYKFDKYLTKKKPSEKNYYLSVTKPTLASASYKQLEAIEAGVFLARDLTSEVPTEMNPAHFATAATALKKLGVKITILTPKQIKKMGMGALHAVGRGSTEGSRLVVAHWKGSDDAPIALVGKGITFDSGGYNVKTGSSIANMKSDMAGAAAVLGTIKAMALQKAPVNVVAVMGMAANMVSKTSVAPGDVIMTAEGKSVEILNTDAEGRLVLADSMWYARKNYSPKVMVDVATLTGSKVRAVGNRFTAVFSEDDELVNQLTASGKVVNEELWRLPLAYGDALKSPIADLQNIGSSGPGATTAAMFLKEFTGDTKWAHLDIAGNALIKKDKGVAQAGGTGHGVRLLSHWILNTQVK
jgi:leucyl aminopeptidase